MRKKSLVCLSLLGAISFVSLGGVDCRKEEYRVFSHERTDSRERKVYQLREGGCFQRPEYLIINMQYEPALREDENYSDESMWPRFRSEDPNFKRDECGIDIADPSYEKIK